METNENKKEADNLRGLPDGLKDSKIKTTFRNMSDLIDEKLAQLKDLATLEVLLDVHVRMKKRLESIKKMSSAEHIKVRGQWKTIDPQIHIRGLQGIKVNNNEVEIKFSVYEADEKGHKKLFKHYTDVETPEGKMVKRVASAEYRVAYDVTEIIKTGKPITREVVRLQQEE